MFNFLQFVQISAAFWLGAWVVLCIVSDACQDKRYARIIRRKLMRDWRSKPSRVRESSEK